MPEFHALQEKMISQDGVGKGLSLNLRPTDVVVSPYGKCGTTWLQQTVHTLRTRGDEEFDDISRVVPWIETSTDLGIDLDAEQKANPRAFKSHLMWDLVPKGGKYIVSIREPKDALVSMYRFMEGWFIEPGAIEISDFARRTYMKRGEFRDYWAHLKSWLAQRDNPNVLLLAYERMSADGIAMIRQVADFIDVNLDDELLSITKTNTSLEYMLANKNKFDDLLMRARSEACCDLPLNSDSSKVRIGEVGAHHYELPEDIKTEMDQIWHEEITQTLGYADYQALLDTFD